MTSWKLLSWLASASGNPERTRQRGLGGPDCPTRRSVCLPFPCGIKDTTLLLPRNCPSHWALQNLPHSLDYNRGQRLTLQVLGYHLLPLPALWTHSNRGTHHVPLIQMEGGGVQGFLAMQSIVFQNLGIFVLLVSLYMVKQFWSRKKIHAFTELIFITWK